MMTAAEFLAEYGDMLRDALGRHIERMEFNAAVAREENEPQIARTFDLQRVRVGSALVELGEITDACVSA